MLLVFPTSLSLVVNTDYSSVSPLRAETQLTKTEPTCRSVHPTGLDNIASWKIGRKMCWIINNSAADSPIIPPKVHRRIGPGTVLEILIQTFCPPLSQFLHGGVKSPKFGFDFRPIRLWSALVSKWGNISETKNKLWSPFQIWYSWVPTQSWARRNKIAPPLKNGPGKFVKSSITQPRIVRFCWIRMNEYMVDPRRLRSSWI